MRKHTLYLQWTTAILVMLMMLAGCSKNNKSSDNQGKQDIHDSVYVKKGDQIVMLTFDTLRSSLQHAISTSNFDGAISFCNESAFPITTTYADTFTINRTALRVRNPDNQPDSLELAVLIEMGNQVQAAQPPRAKVVRSGNKVHYFKPILLQAMCLNCHGVPGQDIHDNTLARIQNLYPSDRAVNFLEGDLRGAWHITFRPQEK